MWQSSSKLSLFEKKFLLHVENYCCLYCNCLLLNKIEWLLLYSLFLCCSLIKTASIKDTVKIRINFSLRTSYIYTYNPVTFLVKSMQTGFLCRFYVSIKLSILKEHLYSCCNGFANRPLYFYLIKQFLPSSFGNKPPRSYAFYFRRFCFSMSFFFLIILA